MNKADKMTEEEINIEIEKIINIIDEKVTEDNSVMISKLIETDLNERENIIGIVSEIYNEYQKLDEKIIKLFFSKRVWMLVSRLSSSVSEKKHALFHLLWDFGIVPERGEIHNDGIRWITEVQLIDSKYAGWIESDSAMDAEKNYLKNSIWTTDIENLKVEDAWKSLGIKVISKGTDTYKYVSKDYECIYDGEKEKTPSEISK